MKITVQKAVEAREVLLTIGGKLKVESMVKIAYCLQELNVIAEAYTKRRLEILKEYAVLDDDGELVQDDKGQAKFEDGQKKKWLKAIEAPYNEEIDVSHTIQLSDLKDLEVDLITTTTLLESGILVSPRSSANGTQRKAKKEA